jgi:Type II CAAX prenyl endopeptidase Rce1-like
VKPERGEQPKRAARPGAVGSELAAKPGAWVEVGLTLPVFLVYHLGVIFLDIRNAADFVSGAIMQFAEGSLVRYLGITLAIGAMVTAVFAIGGRGQAFVPRKFAQIAIEGAVYALVMRVIAGYAVASVLAAGTAAVPGRLSGFVMSMGAGFYEELAFRVLLFGAGYKLLVWLLTRERVNLIGPRTYKISSRVVMIGLGWALACAVAFSGVHYIGSLADEFRLSSFLFRMLLGLCLTAIYATRGFAAAVWTHALYDVWVLVVVGKG